MLGTVSREKEELRARIERLEDGNARIRASLASLSYAAPENWDARIHELICVCRQVVGND